MSQAEPKKSKQEILDDALFNAVGTGNLELVIQGLKAGGNPRTKQSGRHNCLRLAIQRAYFHIVRHFVEKCEMSLKEDKLTFHYAALGNIKHPTMLAYLKENGGDLNYEDEKLGTPLTLGMFKEEVDEMFARWMIKNGAKVDYHCLKSEKSSALHKSVEYASIDLVKLILEKGGKSLLDKEDIKGLTPLIIAAENGREDVVELLLLEERVDANQFTNYTAIFVATQNGHFGTAKLLVDANADVNIVDTQHGCVPLHIAASNNHLAIMRLLLQNGANVDAVDKRGFTSLLMAATEDYEAAVRLLAKHDANLNLATDDGMSPLHLIVSRNQFRMAALLLQLGADPHAKDADGKEPWQWTSEAAAPIVKNVFANFALALDADKVCATCFKTIDGKKRCARCKSVYYCSADCQKVHWPVHKKKCNK